MSGTFPIGFNGRVFTPSDLEQQKYLTGYPELLQAVADDGNNPFVDYSSTEFFVEYGLFNFTVSANRMYVPGMQLTFTPLNTNFTSSFTARVMSYQRATGILTIWVEDFQSMFKSRNWKISMGLVGTHPVYSSARFVPVSAGGTGSNKRQTVAGNFGMAVAPFRSEYFEDFVSGNPISDSVETTGVSSGSTVNMIRIPSANIPAGQQRSGALRIQHNATNKTAVYGKHVFRHLTSGLETKFCTSVYIPTLGSAGQQYVLIIGMKSTNGYMAFKYDYSLNSGRWILMTNAATTNSTTAVAAGWTDLMIVTNGANVEFRIGLEGSSTLLNSIALGALVNTTSADLLGPYFSYNSGATFGTPMGIDIDFWYFSGQVSR